MRGMWSSDILISPYIKCVILSLDKKVHSHLLTFAYEVCLHLILISVRKWCPFCSLPIKVSTSHIHVSNWVPLIGRPCNIGMSKLSFYSGRVVL